jgi:D-alanyl-lipoteichoic acid acyltransferase DltB (MBOAT superfamily)
VTPGSVAFFAFLAVVLVVHRLMPQRHRGMVLLAASYVFYASIGSRLLIVALLAVTAVAYFGGAWVSAARDRRRTRIFGGAVACCLAVLVLMRCLPGGGTDAAGQQIAAGALTIGVSFFTFQGISYLCDVYLERSLPEASGGRFALYMAFFPKLLQGPIERAGNLIPQLQVLGKASPELVESGIKQVVLGLFKKAVIADRIAPYVDAVYANPSAYQGWPLLIATYLYAVQIYCDFSGYTDIALGVSKLFGIKLSDNFSAPYLAASMADFWRRWHISLSSWLADYVFAPLQVQFRRAGVWGVVAALLATFTLCGLWHGFSWNYLTWGLLQGVLLAAGVLWRGRWSRWCRRVGLPPWTPPTWLRIIITFHLVSLSWIVFRATSLADAAHVLTHLHRGLSVANLKLAVVLGSDNTALGRWVVTAALLGALVCHEHGQVHPASVRWLTRHHVARMSFWVALSCSILLLGVRGGRFIYQQF